MPASGVGMYTSVLLLVYLSLSSCLATLLLVTDGLRVLILDEEDLSAPGISPSGIAHHYAVDYHSKTGDLYYSRFPLNGNNNTRGIWKYKHSRKESYMYLPAGTVPGIAVDWVHNNLYYTDESAYTLSVISLDTGFSRVLYTGEETDIPRAVRVDPRDDQRYVYWTDWGENPFIKRCGLDGNNCETLVDEDITWPNSITIEYVNNHLFWLESYNPARVYRSNLDGTDKTMMMGLRGNTRGIDALNETTVYVTDQFRKVLMRLQCHPTHCEVNHTYTGFLNPTDVQVLDSARQPEGTDVCSGLHCPLCLPAVSGTANHTYTCYSERGVLTLRCSHHTDYCANGGVCEEVLPRIRCRCGDPYVGPRCMQYRDGYTPPETTPTTPTTSTTPTPSTTTTLSAATTLTTATTAATTRGIASGSTTLITMSSPDVRTTPTKATIHIAVDACTSEGYTCMNGAPCMKNDDDAPYCDCLPGYQGPSCDIRDMSTYQRPWMQSVVPGYGPLAGGTRVTIRGHHLDVYGVATVYLRHSSNVLCRDVFR